MSSIVLQEKISNMLYIMMIGRNACKIRTGTPTRKRPLGRPRRRIESKIRMDLKEIGINTRNWVDSAHERDY